MKKTLTAKNLITTIVFLVAILIAQKALKPVFAADCETNYGGNKICTTKKVHIKKSVRVCDKNGSNCSEWSDKVINVTKNDLVQFKIVVYNDSSDNADSLDNMSMKDALPSELTRTGGDSLKEYWDNFKTGTSKKFIIDAKVNASEFDRKDFDKCVVNEAFVYRDKKLKDSADATVCYNNRKPTELPKTGANGTVALIGVGLVLAGIVINSSKKYATK